jgi:adenylate cyclase
MDFDESLSFIDLGFVALPSVRVRRRAMLGLLNHHPVSPLCSILELVLLLYGGNASAALCEHMKNRVFRGNEAVHFIDPYVLLFDAACVALAHYGHWDKLNLIRRAFILKIGLIGLRGSRGRRAFIRSIRQSSGFLLRWGWERDALEDAERAKRNSSSDVDELDKAYRENILGLYQELTSMASNSPGRFDEEEVALLGRRLIACFGRSFGQVPPRYSYLIHETPTEAAFFLYDDPQAQNNSRWSVYTELVRRRPIPGAEPLYTAESLPSVLTWAAVNSVTRAGTDIKLVSSDSLVGTALLETALREVESAISFVDPLTLPSQRFARSRRIERAIILVNFDQKRTEEEQIQRERRQYLPSNWDILNYGRDRDSRVRDVAVITRDSWDQV